MPTLTLRPALDAHVVEDAPSANFGSDTVLRVASNGFLRAANQRLLCGYDLDQLPTTATRIVAAELRVKPTMQSSKRVLRCHEVAEPWTEKGVTWTSQPPVGQDLGTQPSDAATLRWDATAPVRSAFPAGRASFRIKDDVEGSVLPQVQEVPSRESGDTPPELIVTYEDQRTTHLASSVRPANIPRKRELRVTVRPLRVAGSATLAAALSVRTSGQRILPSNARPRFHAAGTLGSNINPRAGERRVLPASVKPRVRATRTLRSRVAPRLSDPPGPTEEAPAAIPLGPLAREFLAISDQAGSSLDHFARTGLRRLRRTVQLLDTRVTHSFPRAATSELGQPSSQDLLRRGDAILYAAALDEFHPGDTVAWQGRTWVVVGMLAAEMVGDEAVYREVGLRRLAVRAMAQMRGTVAVPPPE